ncbi:MAG: hypothetical protein M1828_004316 [Chrysothrix sp. TS-e1954]|nr:MAG: hypothetical protein M1828_004316 [Chrysothrix sp. TS-e1954]
MPSSTPTGSSAVDADPRRARASTGTSQHSKLQKQDRSSVDADTRRARAGTGTSQHSKLQKQDPSAPLNRTTTSKKSLASPGGIYSAGKEMLHADIPTGMWSATGQKTGSAPTLPDIRRGTYITHADEDERARRMEPLGAKSEGGAVDEKVRRPSATEVGRDEEEAYAPGSNQLHKTKTGTYPNGYKFPPKHTWQQSTKIGFHAFLHWVLTPIGFLMTIYALNVVAWGAMIFFLLIGAATPEMCFVQRPPNSGHWIKDCDDLYSPRRKWIEIDAQVLTALFCVTAFGLVPWRARDAFFLIKWRVFRQNKALRRLAGWHSSWIRLPGSDQQHPMINDDPESLPLPPDRASDPPLTGIRASPTHLWKLDFFVWMQVLNTVFQIVLCVYMWGQNRFTRPSWATGLFVALGCIVAGIGGLVQFVEGKRIKQIEGVPVEVGEVVGRVESRISQKA